MRTKRWLRRKEAVTVVGGKIDMRAISKAHPAGEQFAGGGGGALNDEPIITLNWKCHQGTTNKTVVRIADAKHREG